MSNDPRENRREIAEETLKILETGTYQIGDTTHLIKDAIEGCLAKTELHKQPPTFEKLAGEPVVLEVTTESSTAAIQRFCKDGNKVAVLNFASAFNPGGGFQTGAQAQEECLARASALYASQMSKHEYYEIHKEERNPYYSDMTIWSQDTPFFRNEADVLCEPFFASILTCAAPNASSMPESLKGKLPQVFAERIRMVLSVAAHYGTTHLVLGAWGCGVFGNDPAMVAKTFKEEIEKGFSTQFKTIAFAIFCPRGPDATLKAFQDAFGVSA